MSKPEIIAAIDVGSGQIACAIGKRHPDNDQVEVVAATRQNCRGLKGGVVINIDETALAISRVVEAAEEMCKETVRDLIIGIRGSHIQTAASIETSFKRLGIKFVSIDVQKNILEVLKKKKIQFCFIALHGTFGEDGGIQSVLDVLKIPYTGSGCLSSALAMDKNLSKKFFRRVGVSTAPWLTLLKSEFESNPKKTLSLVAATLGRRSLFVKPVDQGSALGVTRVTHPGQLPGALKKCFKIADRALIEEFIPGREFTVGILGPKILPAVEIVPEHVFYDFHSKYAKGGSRHLVPVSLSKRLLFELQRLSMRAFKALGCSVYGRVDVLMNSKNKFFVLEVNTIPGMTSTSLLPDAARAAGIHFDELVLKIVGYSLKKKA